MDISKSSRPSVTSNNLNHCIADLVQVVVLGYQHVLSFEKRRIRYELDGCNVEMDELPIIGRFVEIEGSSEEAVIAVRTKLGLADEPIIRSSYIAMLKTHQQETHSSETMIKFEEASVVQG